MAHEMEETAGRDPVAEAIARAARVPVDRLGPACPEELFRFETTEAVPPLEDGIVGQPRAQAAMDFGLKVRRPQYHLYLSGPRGTGKTAYAQIKARAVARTMPVPADWCYLYNFAQPDEPRAVALPAGRGRELKADLANLVAEMGRELRQALESGLYEQRKRTLVETAEAEIDQIWSRIVTAAQLQGFLVQRTPSQVVTIPLDPTGRPYSAAAFSALPEGERQMWRLRERQLEEPLAEGMRRIRDRERQLAEDLKALETDTATHILDRLLSPLAEKYRELAAVVDHLQAIRADVLRHLEYFRGEPDPRLLPWAAGINPEAFLTRYQVNVLVDRTGLEGAPVVVETNPSYGNLFGKIEYRGGIGTVTTDFTMIKPGAIHRANGGYLIVQVKDLLSEPYAYETLKRTLISGEARIENLWSQFGGLVPVSLKPEPIPIQVTVILIGRPDIFQLLARLDEDFRRLFKIQVPFDAVMDNSPQNVEALIQLTADYCRREGLRPLEAPAMRRLVQLGCRMAEDQRKLSTRFSEFFSVVTEADTWAAQEAAPVVAERHVRRAIDEKIYRSNMIESRLQELIAQGTLLVHTEGRAVGEVNGLAVIDVGDYAFGRPSRITARSYLGSRGVLHIERENAMSGRIHSKGVLVLTGFLLARFAQRQPVSFGASITFEQLYEEVDGDSASSAELYALLSELSGLPIDQGIAVTGSVNQKGEVQPIGGVNEKIEGFYRVCKLRGLTGRQGVMIPIQNVPHLVLHDEVVEAIRAGRFHLWAVRTIDEGIAILTGVPAGEPDADGIYPPDTVNGRVSRRLATYAEEMARQRREAGAGSPPEHGAPGSPASAD
ncbi:MAG: AAA family ATPase [Firmicutes bacterium]|nr:AAA family ATPase [Alicyclobacillaceae bacterium]MCL6497340.1 AAA family ATPase [Bacillota bacterium]